MVIGVLIVSRMVFLGYQFDKDFVESGQYFVERLDADSLLNEVA